MTRRDIITKPWLLLLTPFVLLSTPRLPLRYTGDIITKDDWNQVISVINSLQRPL